MIQNGPVSYAFRSVSAIHQCLVDLQASESVNDSSSFYPDKNLHDRPDQPCGVQ